MSAMTVPTAADVINLCWLFGHCICGLVQEISLVVRGYGMVVESLWEMFGLVRESAIFMMLWKPVSIGSVGIVTSFSHL